MTTETVTTNAEGFRKMTDEEMEAFGWDPDHHIKPVVLQLGNGEVVVPSADPELNKPGHLVSLDDDDVFDILPPEET